MPIESIAAVIGGLPNRMERSDVDRAMARLGEIARAPGYLLAIYDPSVRTRMSTVVESPSSRSRTATSERMRRTGLTTEPVRLTIASSVIICWQKRVLN